MSQFVYDISQEWEKVVVLKDDVVFFEVKRHSNFWGKFYSTFFLQNRHVFTSSFAYPFLFRGLALKILYQDLEDYLFLKTSSGAYIFQYRNNIMQMSVNRFENPYIQFFLNGELYGSIHRTKFFDVSSNPVRFIAYFGSDDICNLYFLIFFLMQLQQFYV